MKRNNFASCRGKLIVMILSFLLIAALGLNMLNFKTYNAFAAKDGDAFVGETYKVESESAQDSLDRANELNKEIAAEGFILLKNEGMLPLADKAKVNLFGKNWNDPAFGGSGSSSFSNASGDGVDAYTSMKTAGFEWNLALEKFYADKTASGAGRPAYSYGTSAMFTGETPTASYTDALKATFPTYNTASIVLVTRVGGEGYDVSSFYATKGEGRSDISDHYLMLDDNEQDLISMAAEASASKKAILVINAAQPLQIADADMEKIGAILWVGLPGATGFDALGKILDGEINPSGRTIDTYAKNFLDMPSFQNFAYNKQYTTYVGGGTSGTVESPSGAMLFNQKGEAQSQNEVTYEEGIYVGYRYYETRAFVENSVPAAAANKWWNDNVRYTFGYGLSYSTFEYTAVTYTAPAADKLKTGTVTVDVTVKNTSATAGKEVVQMYYSAPYVENGIEKSHVVLGDFAKTKKLAQNETDTVTLSIPVEQMASYDYDDKNKNGFKTYELDAGDYKFYVGKDAHAWYNAASANTKVMTVPENGYQYELNIDKKADKNDNQFDDMTAGLQGEGINVMSRDDFEGTFPVAPTKEERTVGTEILAKISGYGVGTDNGVAYDKDQAWFTDKMPKQREKALTGKEAGIIKLMDLTGEEYGNAKWEAFLDQLTVTELAAFVDTGFFTTASIPALGIPESKTPDGPFGFVGQAEGYSSARCYYVSPSIVAATFNKELAETQGKSIGEEGVWMGYNGLYAPGANIHRTPFSGRNFEYFSEDGFLSGIMSAQIIKGMQSLGVMPFIKHFALNDQETNRNGVTTWADEQTAREIYLKPFQIAVEDADALGVMSSFNRIGLTWAGASYPLLTNVLRSEWGFKGIVVTDWANGGYMNLDQMIRAGNDLSLGKTQHVTNTAEANTPTHVTAMRNAARNICYAVLNTCVMSKMTEYDDLVALEEYNLCQGETVTIDFSSKTFEDKYSGITYKITKSDILSENVTPVVLAPELPSGYITFNESTGIAKITIPETEKAARYQLTVSIKLSDGKYLGQSATTFINYTGLTAYESMKAELEAKTAELQKALDAAMKTIQTSQDASSKEIAALQASAEALKTALDSANAAIAALQTAQEENAAALKAALDAVTAALEANKADIKEDIKGDLSEITKNNIALQTALDKANGLVLGFGISCLCILVIGIGACVFLMLKKKSK